LEHSQKQPIMDKGKIGRGLLIRRDYSFYLRENNGSRHSWMPQPDRGSFRYLADCVDEETAEEVCLRALQASLP
jgi:hypothetical protein